MLVVLSQRTHDNTRYVETWDCLDQQWARLIGRIGGMAVPLPNLTTDSRALLDRLQPDAVLLTGGADPLPAGPEASARNDIEEAMLSHAAARGVPVLAVCRGMQAVNVRLGGRVERVAGHVARNHSVVAPDDTAFVVNSFHDFGIAGSDLAAALEPLLVADDGTVEAARHRELPWTSLMWHPERPGPDPAMQERIVSAALRGAPILPAVTG
ncbi:MAG: gamma-glutamyl-gamma-aminobutyrate hydrolase family protein [Alsobacter sp.]